ncbi:MAG TPA: phage holin family protein [Euzebyales bacterium]|nr:phage holin family protein [Euzebyales bacterium]
MTEIDTDGRPPPGSRYTFGARPTIGAATALKAVAQDTSELVRAEIDLAKAELTQGVMANGLGMGLMIGAAVLLWLAVQGLLIAAGFALALVMPGWAAALIVAGVLILIAAVLMLIGRNKLGTPVSVEQAKTNVQEDMAWVKTHLRGR